MQSTPRAPLISIVTLSYNQAAYLEQALRSVIEQDYPFVEYIVVDPGSNDGSREIIKQYGAHIAHVLLEPDSGPADGLNKGFALATGDIFGYLNSDDFFLPNALSRVAKEFDDECIEILVGDGILCDASGTKVRRLSSTAWSSKAYVYGGANAVQPATFFRSSLFRSTKGFNTLNRTCWDGELLVDLAELGGRVIHFPHELAAFRLHDASITGSRQLASRYAADADRLFERVIGRPRKPIDHLMSLYYRSRKKLRIRA
jgi:glycosyltransferase involved in cell wall biosynthesis